MSRKDHDGRSNRRGFLKQVGAGLTATITLGSASASAKEEDEVLRATGKRIHRFIPNEDTYTHEMRFVSPDLQDRYGSATALFDEGEVPKENINPPNGNPNKTIVVKYDDTGIFGSPRQHATAERQLRQSETRSSSIGTMSHLPGYSGPLYTYNSSDSTSIDTSERTAPINVAFTDETAYSAWYRMRNNGWGTFLPEGERYIVLGEFGNEYTKAQDESAQKSSEWWSGAQYHTRLYNLPDADDGDDYPCIGQAHHDPWDHEKFTGDDNWKFAESRREVRDTWTDTIGGYSAETVNVYNGSGYGGDVSSNGKLTKIY